MAKGTGYAVCVLKDDEMQQQKIYECPKYTLEPHNWVKVETNVGPREAIVLAVLNYIDDDTESFIRVLTQKRSQEKVISIITEREFTYNDEDEFI